MAFRGEKGKWLECKPGRACPICEKTKWCSVSEDQVWCCCRHKQDGCKKTKTDSDGVTYFVHQLIESPNGDGKREEPRYTLADGKGEIADPDTLDRVYTAILDNLPLYPHHASALTERGLKVDHRAAGYRTLGRERVHAVWKLVQAGMESLFPRVPSLVIQVGKKSGKRYWSIAGPPGLLITVRDVQRRIIKLYVRPDEIKGAKYLSVSSKKHGGVGPGNPIHVPLFGGQTAEIRLTEEALKADVATFLSKILTIGLPGLGGAARLLPILAALGVKTVRLALDSDATSNPNVARALRGLAKLLHKHGYSLILETWKPEQGKGIDDLLKNGHEPNICTGDEVLAMVEVICEEAKKAKPQSADLPPLDEDHLTDLGNAKLLVERFGADFHYCKPMKADFVWNGRWWKEDQTLQTERWAKAICADLYQKAMDAVDYEQRKRLMDHALTSERSTRIAGMISLARSEPSIPITADQMDGNPWLLTVLNGTLDLEKCELREHRREDLITKVSRVEFNPAAKCPLWDKFLQRNLDGNADLIGYLQRVIGYCLTGSVREHVLWLFYGLGANGKSVFLTTIEKLLGDYAIQTMSDLLLQTKSERHSTERADLFGKRLALTIEVDEGKRLAEALTKQLTGGDNFRARRCYENSFEFSPTWKFIIAANRKPEIRGTDYGIWRRIKVVPWTVTIPESEKDTELSNKLKTELSGILNWALAGCRQWMDHGLGEPDEVTMASDEYRREQDQLAGFIAECCVQNREARVQAKLLYDEYLEFIGVKEVTQPAFGKMMRAAGYETKPGTDNRKFWHGIGLIPKTAPGLDL